MYFYLMFIVLLFTDPIVYSYALFQKCEMLWKDYLMHKNNPTQSNLEIENGNNINFVLSLNNDRGFVIINKNMNANS